MYLRAMPKELVNRITQNRSLIPRTPFDVGGRIVLRNQTLIAVPFCQLVGFKTVGGQTAGYQSYAICRDNFFEKCTSSRKWFLA